MKELMVFSLLFLLSSNTDAGNIGAPTRRAILEAQDQRNGPALTGFMTSQEAEVRRAAIIAAGSVQDTAHLPLLFVALGDSSPLVRSASAFALGQMTGVVSAHQREIASDRLLEALAGESVNMVLVATVQALGKCGSEASLSALVEWGIERNEESQIPGEVALAVGRYGYRGIRNQGATAFIAAHLAASRPVSWQAAYALMRIGVDSVLETHVGVMEEALRQGDADVRMYLCSALGTAGESRSVPLLIDVAERDEDWRVRVSAVRALGLIESPEAREGLLRFAGDANEHVSLTALNAIAASGARAAGVLHSILVDRSASGRQRGAAAFALASVFRDSVAGVLRISFEENLCPEGDYLRSLGKMTGVEPFNELLSFSRSSDPVSQRAAIEALVAMTSAGSDTTRSDQVTEMLLGAVRSDDMAVITTAADALSDSLFFSARTAGVLAARLLELHAPDDVEPMVAMIRTLGSVRAAEAKPVLLNLLQQDDRTVALESAETLTKIDGGSYHALVRAHSEILHTDYDWPYLEDLYGATAIVETEAGSFEFGLLPGEAPFTCVSFARLIERKFYDGLIFHRVVPNFVVQGGDPRGDGWGGPGFSIRSEFGTIGYEPGMVGVASAGKDTEGCQFFVTHSKQPHLDGRYTIFGRVTAGMETVDRIQVGDRIVRMRIERGGD